MKKTLFLLGASFGGLAPAQITLAQQTTSERILEEITVTAQYREQGLQDVPISVSAVTGDTLTRTALQKAEDIQFLVPNFNMTETGISTSVFIRGIGSGINQGFEQSVGYYIDGVHYPRGQQSRMPFLDLERVEVLRGPQSILFGKNSVAGALNITTAKPTDEFEGSIFVSAETEDGETIVEGMLSGPFSDRVRARIAARSRDSDGYIHNATLSRDEPNRKDWTVRGTMEFDITDNVMATFKAEVGDFDVKGRHVEVINEQPSIAGPPLGGLTWSQILVGAFGQDPSVLNNTQDGIRSSNDDFSFNSLETYVLTFDWALGEFDLKSVSAWETFDYDEFCDCDFTGADVFGAALQEKYEQFSQEFRLTSPLNDNFDYILGLYYQTSDHEYHDQIIVDPASMLIPAINLLTTGNPTTGSGNLIPATEANRTATVDNEVLSGFAQFNWHLSDAWTLQLGGRVTKDQRDGFRTLSILAQGGGPLPAAQFAAPLVYGGLFGITSTNLSDPLLGPTAAALVAAYGSLPVSGSRDKTKFSPDVKVVWDVNDDVMLYTSWARGFKSGSFDFRANNRNFYPDTATSFEFEDEEANNFELGGKFAIGGTAEINATWFFTDYKDLQISIFDGVLGFNVGNAATAEILGFEIDARIAAGDYFTISGGLAYLDFEFTDFKNGQCYFGQTPDVDLDGDGTPELCDYTGQSNQMVSKWQGNVTFDFRYPIGSNLEFSALLDVFYKGDHDTANTFDPALKQDAYTKLNARVAIGAESGRWEIALLGRNLSDEKVLQYGGDLPLAGSTFGAKGNYAFFSQGRTLSVQGTLRF